MKIGVISDTHNYLDPQVAAFFRGVEHILHGGDIGQRDLLAELETIAPVTAVAGNTDHDPGYRETATVTLSGLKILVHHIVTPGAMREPIDRQIAVEAPNVVVFGHTHKPYAQQWDKTFFFNPGYAGKQRFDLPRTLALLDWTDGRLRHQFISL